MSYASRVPSLWNQGVATAWPSEGLDPPFVATVADASQKRRLHVSELSVRLPE